MSESENSFPKEAPSAHGHGPVDPNQPVNPDYTDKDIHLDTVRKFMFGSLGVTLAFFVLMLIVHTFYKKSFIDRRGIPTVRQIPQQGPILQTKPLEGKLEYLQLENSRLNVTTNLGPHAVIPPAAAMQILLDEGAFPTPAPKENQRLTPPPALAQAAPVVTAAPSPAPVQSVVVAPPTPEPQALPPAESVQTEPAAALDPAMVAAGKAIWEAQCMAACHTGKKGAIAPNIQNAFGTMRKLEGGGEILMDEAYIHNSLINPNEHVAKGYMPVMMSFKELLTEEQRNQVVAYLKSQGTAIPAATVAAPSAPATVPAPAVVVSPEPTVAPTPAPTPTPAVTLPTPVPAESPVPAAPAPASTPAPTPTPTPSYIFI